MILHGGSGLAMIVVSGRPRAGERRAALGRNRHKGLSEGLRINASFMRLDDLTEAEGGASLTT
jgi:hypothetical protein